MANPDLGEEHVEEIRKKNESAIDAEGWLHSGDKVTSSHSGHINLPCHERRLSNRDVSDNGARKRENYPIRDSILTFAVLSVLYRAQ